jgi:hypothetical protein
MSDRLTYFIYNSKAYLPNKELFEIKDNEALLQDWLALRAGIAVVYSDTKSMNCNLPIVSIYNGMLLELPEPIQQQKSKSAFGPYWYPKTKNVTNRNALKYEWRTVILLPKEQEIATMPAGNVVIPVDKAGKTVEYKGFLFSFKAADTSDNSIICYGWCNYTQGRKPDHKRFKIVYKADKYKAYAILGRRGYTAIGFGASLETSMLLCKNYWCAIWMPKPTHIEFEEPNLPKVGDISGIAFDRMMIDTRNGAILSPTSDSIFQLDNQDALSITINPELYSAKLSGIAPFELIDLIKNKDDSECVELLAKYIQPYLDERDYLKQMALDYKKAYHALNSAGNNLQTRLNIAETLKKYNSEKR